MTQRRGETQKMRLFAISAFPVTVARARTWFNGAIERDRQEQDRTRLFAAAADCTSSWDFVLEDDVQPRLE